MAHEERLVDQASLITSVYQLSFLWSHAKHLAGGAWGPCRTLELWSVCLSKWFVIASSTLKLQ